MRSPLVGREGELGAIAFAFDEAARGRGSLAMLVGEPGIGKSRLADAAATEADRRGFKVAWGRAWESGGAPAFYPWTQALESLDLHAPDASLATAVDGEAARFQVFRAISGELRAASAKKPILLVLDDLHVADVSSLRMLHFIARELRSMKVVIVGTRRDLDAAMTLEVDATLARIAREGRTFVLGRLRREDVERFVQSEGPRIPADLRGAIWDSTQGNPLFVGEVVRLLEADSGVARGGAVPVPSGAREILRQRLEAIDDGARDILETAAAIGVEVDEVTLAAASDRNGDAVADVVAAAVRAGILVHTGDRRARFSHALFRDALYRELPRARRASLHGAIAAALERTTPAPWVEIAHHATLAGEQPLLVGRTSRAARALTLAYADEDAIRLIEQAIAALGASEGAGRDVAELGILLAHTRMRIGDIAGGRANAAGAADIARNLGDGALFARAALAHAGEVTQGATDATTHRLLEEATRLVSDESSGGDLRALAVRLKARLAASLQPAPDPAAAGRMALEAVHTARALGDDDLLLDVLHDSGGAFGEAFFSPEVVDMARDAVRLASRSGDRSKLFRARIRLAFALMVVGDVATADANIETFESEARATGQARHIWPAPLLRAMRALQEGRFDDAALFADEARELGASDPAARSAVFMHRFAALRMQERGPELLALEPQILAVVARWNDGEAYVNLMMGIMRALAGDLDTARAHLARVPLDSTPGRIRLAIGALADATIRVGDASRAAELYERLLPDADRWHVFMFGGFSAEATYARYLGGLASLAGDYATAERHFEAALARAESASARPECARILAAHGAMLLSRGGAGDEARAHDLFARARPIAEELGLSCMRAQMPASNERRVSTLSSPPLARELSIAPDGETWQITLGAASVRLKNSRGIAYIARLVAEAGREVHALDLAGGEGADGGDAGEVLDPEARAAYKRRLAELDGEVREAEQWNDGARVHRARAEIELLSSELSRAVGMGGRSRRTGSSAERARVAVTRRIRDAIRRVAEQSAELGRYLEATVKTGVYCSYRPMP